MFINKIFFQLNIDKQFNRQVHALEILSAHTTAISIHELAHRIGCSIPTLRNDLHELNGNLPVNIEIQSCGKDGYKLQYPEGTSITTVIMELAKDTDVFRIIDTLFQNKILTFDEMLSELYVNPSTLNRIISHMSDVLKDYGITISKSPVRFVGTEANIRLFLFNFYYDFNDYYTVDPDYEKNYDAYKAIFNYSRNSLAPNLNLCYFRATMWVMIIRKRLEAKCTVEIDESYEKRIEQRQEFTNFKEALIEAFADKFLIYKPCNSEIAWAYSILLHCISYCDLCNEGKTSVYTFKDKHNPDFVAKINAFLSLEFEESIVQSHYLDRMRAYLINLETLSTLSNQFQRLSMTTRLSLKQSLNDYYMIWMCHLYSKESMNLFPIEYREDIAISLAMLHLSARRQMNQHMIQVLFAFQGEPGYGDFLINQTQFMIPNNIGYHFSFDEPISDEVIRRTNADLVVTNYDSPEFNRLSKKVIRLSYLPSKTEWEDLGNIILKLVTFEHATLQCSS